ncbi:MAG TPA: hypothetical protein VMT91_02110 [Anaerolineales bacterium]|nr:hypothetical protein [Anaerolineales bacterium]
MTIYPEKASVAVPPPALTKQTARPWLNFLLVVLQAATILPLPAGADGIHYVAGMLLLAACGLHLMGHRPWIKAVVLNKPENITPTLQRRRRLFWAMLVSGLLCGLSGPVALLLDNNFPSLLRLVTRIHALSGLTFISLSMCHFVSHRNWFSKRIGAFFHAS